MSYNINRSATIYRPSVNPSLRNRRSLTLDAIDIPKNDRKSLDDVQQQIIRNHQSINGIISRFKEVVAERLQAQELQLLLVFKNSLDKMMTQIEEIVVTYRKATEQVRQEKNFDKLENELKYFKTEALQLFEINQSHKREIAELKKTISDLKIDHQSQTKVIQKLTRKVFKLKGRNESLLSEHSKSIEKSLPFVTQESTCKVGWRYEHRKTITSSLGKQKGKSK